MMKNFSVKFILLFLVAALPYAMQAKDTHNNVQCFKHNIQLQLSDSLGFPVDGTQFWVTLDVIKQGNLVTIQFPVINFQTGQVSTEAPIPPLVPGGYLYTSDGFLPDSILPNDLVYRSIVAASNNGVSEAFSFIPTATLPTPPVGYILSVTNAGAVVVQCAGTFGNIIPPGPQILMPCSITYIVKPKVSLCQNTVISTGFTNVTQFTNPASENIGLRDSHVNDAFDGRVAFAWSDNSMESDKTNGILNVMVAIGEVNNGVLTVGTPVQITNITDPNFTVFDTAIAINRTNKDNIVVSYGLLGVAGGVFASLKPYRAVSFDGGKTWPENGPVNIQPSGNPSDCGDVRGVASDKFGNIWYSYTNAFDNSGNETATPSFLASSDGGVTYQLVFTAPPPVNIGDEIYDYPQYCFGGDGLGNYGLNFVVDYLNFITADIFPSVGFIPITGLGSFGASSFAKLTSFANATGLSDISASADGRVWIQGIPDNLGIKVGYSYIEPIGIIFKSPGALTSNYAGVWQQAIVNCKGIIYGPSIEESDPGLLGYFPNSVQSIVYDDSRQALYALVSATIPDNAQNMRIYFLISRDNGQTWSDPIDISTTAFANRGFQSMALDSVTGNLVFGWYDGRNDSTFQSVQYFGAILPATQLDALVNKIPLSNPLYTLPAATGIVG